MWGMGVSGKEWNSGLVGPGTAPVMAGATCLQGPSRVEQAQAQSRSPLRAIKRYFGYSKVRFRGLAKNMVSMIIVFTLLAL
jgi:IS5 family transposase